MTFAHVTRDNTINPDTIRTTEVGAMIMALVTVYNIGFPNGYPSKDIIETLYNQESNVDGGKVRPVMVTVARLN